MKGTPMKRLLVLLALLPAALAFAQQDPTAIPHRTLPTGPPSRIRWSIDEELAKRMHAGWKFGPSPEDDCQGMNPQGRRYVFKPRPDGLCHAEDAR
jgi:hypothetical protein